MGCAPAKGARPSESEGKPVNSKACIEHFSRPSDGAAYSARKDAPVENFLPLCDLTLRKWPGFSDIWYPICPATTVREGIVVTGQLLTGSDGGEFVRIVVQTCPEQGSFRMFCFLPMHAAGDPSRVLIRKYQLGEAMSDTGRRLLDEEVRQRAEGGEAEARRPFRTNDTLESHPDQRRYLTLQPITQKKADYESALPEMDITTVEEGVHVTGQLVTGDDGGAHVRIVIVTPPNEGARHVFCFLPVHEAGAPDKPLMKEVPMVPADGATPASEQTGEDKDKPGGKKVQKSVFLDFGDDAPKKPVVQEEVADPDEAATPDPEDADAPVVDDALATALATGALAGAAGAAEDNSNKQLMKRNDNTAIFHFDEIQSYAEALPAGVEQTVAQAAPMFAWARSSMGL